MGLRPRISRRKNGTRVDYATGGCHFHLGIANLFFSDTSYLANLAAFERNLYIDYANRPYIKWLFAEWFDDGTNCRVGWKPHIWNREFAHEYSHNSGLLDGTISPRFSGANAKKILPTYEFRMFDSMPSNTRELLLYVRFLSAWMAWVRLKTLACQTIPLTINGKYFKSLKSLRTGWREISTFLCLIGLDPLDYRAQFERCYVPRMKSGKMI